VIELHISFQGCDSALVYEWGDTLFPCKPNTSV